MLDIPCFDARTHGLCLKDRATSVVLRGYELEALSRASVIAASFSNRRISLCMF